MVQLWHSNDLVLILSVWITTTSLYLIFIYIFLLISKTITISALILSPHGNTSLYKTEKPFHPTERELNITPIPVFYKKNFTKLPAWDFEDVYLRDSQPRKPVSAPFSILFLTSRCSCFDPSKNHLFRRPVQSPFKPQRITSSRKLSFQTFNCGCTKVFSI